jgi:hypothetical protein
LDGDRRGKIRIRKPIVLGSSWRPEMPVFASVAWIKESHNHRLAYLALDWEHDDFRFLEHRDVIIDGGSVRCVGLRKFFVGSHRKGDLVALIVADVRAANQNPEYSAD